MRLRPARIGASVSSSGSDGIGANAWALATMGNIAKWVGRLNVSYGGFTPVDTTRGQWIIRVDVVMIVVGAVIIVLVVIVIVAVIVVVIVVVATFCLTFSFLGRFF